MANLGNPRAKVGSLVKAQVDRDEGFDRRIDAHRYGARFAKRVGNGAERRTSGSSGTASRSKSRCARMRVDVGGIGDASETETRRR